MLIRFPPWRPDEYSVGDLGATAGDANGVRYGRSDYGPWPQPVDYSQALAAACRGAITVRDTSGDAQIFAFTSAAASKFVDSATAWTDVTRSSGGAYTAPSGERWSMTQFGDYLVAVNINDAPQVITITGGTNFAALGGSPNNARICQTVGEFLFLGGISGEENRVEWSARRDHTFWTAGTRDAGGQSFQEGGPVRGITPMGGALIFQEGAIRRFEAVDSTAVFGFFMVERRRGLAAKDSLVTLGGYSFYLSDDGFYVTDGSGQSLPIGDKKVNGWFTSNVNQDRIGYTIGAAEPGGRRIYWLFPSTGNAGEELDYCLCYDLARQEWSYSDDFADSWIGAAQTAGYTLESMDDLISALGYTSIEDFPISFDDASLSGGAAFLASFAGDDFIMRTHTGAARAATLETADWQPFEGRRAFVQGCQMLTDASNATATFGRKERPQGAVTFGSAISQTDQGYCPTRSSGRFHRVRMSIAANESWTHAAGVDVDAVPEGRR